VHALRFVLLEENAEENSENLDRLSRKKGERNRFQMENPYNYYYGERGNNFGTHSHSFGSFFLWTNPK
jgi:hypothetical protein